MLVPDRRIVQAGRHGGPDGRQGNRRPSHAAGKSPECKAKTQPLPAEAGRLGR